jgi:hypothetical protein
MRRSAFFVGLAVVVAGLAGGAGALEIHGSAIAEYRDGELLHPSQAPAGAPRDNSRPSTWRFTQADITMREYLGDYNEVFARLTFAPGVPNILSEAWLAQDGLGPGRLTAGQFFKPRGAPIPVLGLSIPTLLFRTFSQVGVKYGGDYRGDIFRDWTTGTIRYEVGVTNTNPITLRGATVGDAFLIGRPHAGTWTSGPREAYGHLGWQNGGAWGSLDASVTGTFGKLMASDITTLNTSGLFSRNSRSNARNVWDAAVDYSYGPFQVFAQYARERAGDLRHKAWAVGGSYWFRRDLRFTLAHDDYRINADAPALVASRAARFAIPASWDRDRTALSATWEASPGLSFTAEYEWNDENARLPDGREISNDVFTVQALAFF